jgi:hypothetical protein
VDFAMGGSYGWTARVFPKADFLITLRNSGGWDYRPLRITLAFPPGTGSVRLLSASAQLK